MARIVTSTYRYKRPPKRKKAVALEVPPIVTKGPKRGLGPSNEPPAAAQPAEAPTSRIVTAWNPKAANLPPGLLPDAPKEHRQRGDAADALFRELVRRATGKS